MKLSEIEIGTVYEYLGGRYKPAPVRTVEETRIRSGGTSYRGFMVVFAPDAWTDPEPLPTEPFPAWPKQLRRPWVNPPQEGPLGKVKPGESTVPLNADDVLLLTRLAFQWDTSPQEAMRRALRQALREE